MSLILIVDDEPNVRVGLARAMASAGHETVTAASIVEARAALRRDDLDCVLLDIRLKDGDGLALLDEMRTGPHRETPVIIATAYGDSERTIRAMKTGAFEYVTKPFDLLVLLRAVARAVRSRSLGRALPKSSAAPSALALVGSSAPMQQVWKTIGRAAASEAPVLIVGETGTGKELVARAIHDHSSRKDGPFAAVNLAALSSPLLESELFGHEKGAFTGAINRKIGRFEAASVGTLFLDEVGDLDAALQTKVLRVLQDGRFERVGGTDTISSAPRIVAATNKSVRPSEPKPTLRDDLYYRLAVIEIEVPPLRERRSDIPLLVNRALQRTQARAVSEEAMARLLAYHWPGNVRELFHVIERAAVMCSADIIDLADLPPLISSPSNAPASPFALDECDATPLREAVRALERRLITRALERASGSRTEAARILGIARPQLYAKMDDLGLSEKR